MRGQLEVTGAKIKQNTNAIRNIVTIVFILLFLMPTILLEDLFQLNWTISFLPPRDVAEFRARFYITFSAFPTCPSRKGLSQALPILMQGLRLRTCGAVCLIYLALPHLRECLVMCLCTLQK